MAQAIVVRELGGPEVLKLEGVTLSPPGPGEVQIRQVAVGLNFIDVYFRTGLYKSASGLPFVPGKEGAGTIRRSQLAEIAEMKMKDLNANDIEAATKIIEGSARAMGLQVVEG